MEFNQIGKLNGSHKVDGSDIEVSGKCEENGGLGEMFSEINNVYTQRLRKLDELGHSMELRTRLLYAWVADLLEQNSTLVEALADLERVAAQHVLLLENKLRKSSTALHNYTTELHGSDGQTAVSLRALVACLEVDIGSLLELIRRARCEGCWDVRGLVFTEVTYWDIFGSAPPPPSASMKDEARELLQAQESRSGGTDVLQQKLAEAYKLVAKRDDEIQQLGHKLDDTEQHSRDVQAVLAAEVAEKHDQVVQLRQRLQRLEEDCRLGHMQTHFRDQIIKGMRKEVKRFRSQLAVLDPSFETATSTCTPCKQCGTVEGIDLGWSPPSESSAKEAHNDDSGISEDRVFQSVDGSPKVSDTPIKGGVTT